MSQLRVGIVGLGNISGIYLDNLGASPLTKIVAVADLLPERARQVAQDRQIPLALTPDELIQHPEVDLVLNLTIPAAHGPVTLQAIRAGKHVYNEKPLAIDLELAQELVREASERNLLVGCAPDTFLGAGIQTAIEALDRGDIGEPVAIRGRMLARGPEPWHPAPEFFYKRGGGPMLDMGPYYLTAYVALLGPISRIAGLTRISYPQRPIPLSNERYYADRNAETPDHIVVETPTHLAGVLEFASGAIGELTTSFDVYGDWPENPITLFGSEGSMEIPDPNTFGGPVKVRKQGGAWHELPLSRPYGSNSRGVGVFDIADAIQHSRSNRASGTLAAHVLEAMLAFEKSSVTGQHISLNSHGLARPQPLPANPF